MKQYGWRRGLWRDEEYGPTSKHRNMSSKKRQHERRCLKKQERSRTKQQLWKVQNARVEQ